MRLDNFRSRAHTITKVDKKIFVHVGQLANTEKSTSTLKFPSIHSNRIRLGREGERSLRSETINKV